MRLFLGLNLPQEVKDTLYSQIEPLRRAYPEFRWVTSPNYHITLFFLGNTHSIDRITKDVEETIFDIETFRMYSQDVSLFMRENITLYVGFAKNHTLLDIVKRLKARWNLYEKHSFFPHLTIARTRIPSKQQYLLIKKKFTKHTVDIEFDVSRLTLFETVMEKDQPQYNILKEFPLLPRPKD